MTQMPKSRKSFQEKLADNKGLPKIVAINDKMSKKWGEGTMVVPAPIDVDEVMHQVIECKLITINHIREILAIKYKTNICCPLTTGIFAWIAAYAAEEAASEGKTNTTPYWRTLKSGGVVNEKFPGGIEAQIKLLESEGHKIIKNGKLFVVENYLESIFII